MWLKVVEGRSKLESKGQSVWPPFALGTALLASTLAPASFLYLPHLLEPKLLEYTIPIFTTFARTQTPKIC